MSSERGTKAPMYARHGYNAKVAERSITRKSPSINNMFSSGLAVYMSGELRRQDPAGTDKVFRPNPPPLVVRYWLQPRC